MTITPVGTNQFSKCLPALRTNIEQCGSVTLCESAPMTVDQINTVYATGGKYRLMTHLLTHDIEMKMCGKVENGLYDFLATRNIDLSASIDTKKLGGGTRAMVPFILARQKTPINTQTWTVWQGNPVSGGNYKYDLTSPEGIPISDRWFHVGDYLFMTAVVSNVVVHSNFVVVSSSVTTATIGGVAATPVIEVIVTPQNTGSNLPSAQTTPPSGTGGLTGLAVATAGTPNVSDWESYCHQTPGIINTKFVPFWLQTTRNSLCTSSQYEMWRDMMLEQNMAYEALGDLDEIEQNAQLAKEFKQRHVESIFRRPAISSNQTTALYTALDTITAASSESLDLSIGGECVGFRANAVGIYEQFAECGRLCDANGAALNMDSLFQEIYNMMRVRQGADQAGAAQFDLFTDRNTANKINQAMIAYYKLQAGSTDQGPLVFTKSVDSPQKKAQFGFNWQSYEIFNPQVTLNVITHNYFNDWSDALTAAGQGGAGRVIWIIDFSGIKIGVVAANTIVNNTGDLKNLAAVDSTFLCTMRVSSKKQKLMSMMYTVICECPKGNLIIENFSTAIPVVTANSSVVYPCSNA